MEYSGLWSIIGVTVVSGIALYLWWLRKNDDYWKIREVPYAPRVGFLEILRVLGSKPFHELLDESYKKYGRVYGGFEFRTPNLTVCDPALLKDILVKDFQAFNFRRDFQIGDPILDKMVSLLKDQDWKRVRTIISPAFTSRRMRQMTNIINECSKTVVETIGKYHDREEPVNVKSIFGAFTIDVIARAAFATKINSHNDPENIFVKNVKKIFPSISIWRFLIFVFIPKRISILLRLGAFDSIDFFRKVVVQVIKDRKNSGKKYDDVLQLFLDSQEEFEAERSKLEMQNDLLEDESDQYGSVLSNEVKIQKKYKTLSEDELVAQCVLFFIVGYETTASTLSFMAYSLAINPESQEKLIKEIDEAFDIHKKLDYDVIRDMKYLDCAVSETLRMYPPATRAERTVCENYKLGNTGIVVEKGTVVGFNIYSMHHDEEFFSNPEVFRPERFLPENANHPQYTYLPFGAGPRNCLGMRFALMEIKLCICNILLNYRFQKAPATKVPMEFAKGNGFLTVDTLPLLVEKRQEKFTKLQKDINKH